MEIFNFLKVQYMIIKISILSDHENMVCSFNFCFEKLNINTSSLRKKFPYSELFWSVFSRIWTEYWEIRQSNSEYRQFLRRAFLLPLTRSTLLKCCKKLAFCYKWNNKNCKCINNLMLILCLQPATLLKKLLQHSCFPVSFAKLLRAIVMQNICERLLLRISPLLDFFVRFIVR